MTKLLKPRSKKLGTPPGSLIYTGDNPKKLPQITVWLYDASTIVEKHPRTIEEAFSFLQENVKIWIQICGISDPNLINNLGSRYKLHPLMLEDIMNPTQRSKLDDYRDHLYIVTHLLQYKNDGAGAANEEQLSMVVGKDLLITLLDRESDILKPIEERLQKTTSKMRLRGPDYLAYAILDTIVDNYFMILEQVDQHLENLEHDLLNDPKRNMLLNIQKATRVLALIRKTIWPMREMLSQFRRIDSPLISDATRVYASDVYDHTVQAIETVESFRDVAAGMIHNYLSTINQRLNEIMRVLTVVATIFVPLTFISSLYGMNFDYMPELHSRWGYPIVLGLMLAVCCGMLYFFRRKRWI
jgi:magnesium transporter